MERRFYTKICILNLIFFLSLAGNNLASAIVPSSPVLEVGLLTQVQDTINTDTIGNLPFPFKDQPSFDFQEREDTSKLYLGKPSNIKYEIQYDPETGEYIFYEKVGTLNYRLPKTMSLDDYIDYDFKNSVESYWRQRTNIEDMQYQGSLIPKLTIEGEAFNRIFGGNTVNIRPQGYVEVSFGYQMNATENPAIPERLRRVPTFDFDEKIQMNVVGQIGEKMNMRVNYNTEATFDFENKMNLEYTGDEDEIIKRIEAGNVSLPLNGTLITGASNLFGIKAEMQFGKLSLTTLISQNKGETKVVQTEEGAQVSTFDIEALNYDANRHFFLAQYFKDNYDAALKDLPVVRSSITINKIEVWVTNKQNNSDNTRNLIALQDLGEHEPNIYNNIPEFAENLGLPYPLNIYPANEANGMYEALTTTYSAIRNASDITSTMSAFGSNFSGGRDFEKIERARKLSESEYTVNKQLGYISLNSALNNDEVLSVAYNYTANGQTFQVGEFSTDGINDPQVLILKLLKGTNLSPSLPTWDLMMKNIYDIGASSLTNEDFIFRVMYRNDSTGTFINYIPEGRIDGNILLSVMNLDKLNTQLDPYKDGLFDFVNGVTVDARNGKIIFPVLQPFGKHLADSIQDPALIEKYVFQSLYDSTKTFASQDAEHNKFRLQGSFKGSSSADIAIGAINVARGSVKVTAGGMTLTENSDYTVDYALGRVKIINPGLIEAGTPIQVSVDTEDLFSMQRKTMLGAYANYAFSDNFNIGGTFLHMQERPLTEKVEYGADPISNSIFGFETSYTSESQFITKMLDALPLINTKTTSSINFEAEYAKLIPGHSKVVGESGTVYVDDFEATKTSIDLKSRQNWVLASTPQNQEISFPEGNLNGALDYNFNRAKLAWYVIDPLFLRNNSITPSHIKGDVNQQSNHYVREIFEEEIFPQKESVVGEPTNIAVLDLAYYPSERGPYNYETTGGIYSAGLNTDGTLRNPESRWGGIMREIQTPDFETANIEFIEFWMMDPFIYDSLGNAIGGDLYFNLGDISEDILKDSRKAFEHGLPTSEEVVDVDTSIWGRVSTLQAYVEGFNNDPLTRDYQDVGLDGLSDADERTFFEDYLNKLTGVVDQEALDNAVKDPSNDNYHYFRGSDFDTQELGILERYKNYNGTDGNSPTDETSPETYITAAKTIPDIEDINDDNTLSEYERYYQYRVSIRPEDLVVGKNYITDVAGQPVELENGKVEAVKWYQFKVPVTNPEEVFGSINDFKSIRFIRMYMKGFEKPVILRFATLDLIRSDWRKYTNSLTEPNGLESLNSTFDISAVNIEENGDRDPVNYILPPGIDRVIDPANPQLRQLNEQSLVLKVTDLEMGDAKAAYKSLYMDFRNYKTLKMEIHAEEIDGYDLEDDDLSVFIRLGSDYNLNYYEYELPLKLTPPGNYNGDFEADRLVVWPDENRLEIPMELFTDAKLLRNQEVRKVGSNITMQDVFEVIHENYNNNQNTIKVKGNPNLGNVEVMMMGVRHKTRSGFNPGPKSVEVWLNELRLGDFDEEGGWAANARVSARLADLGSVTMAARHRSAGFGSIESSVNERSMDDITEFDIATSLDLGKLLPEKSRIRLPMYYSYSKSTTTPKYDPLNPDVELEESLNQFDTKHEKDSIKSMAQELVIRKSLNFTNVKLDPNPKRTKPRIYDLSNFAVTYSYNETFRQDVNTEVNLNKTYRGMLSYNYSTRPKLITPFKKVKFLQKGPLKLIGDFNFYPLPAQISFRTDLYRHYNEIKTRSITNPDLIIKPTYNKEFLWNRYFDLRYNITRTLKFDFSSNSTSRIDEPEGRIDRNDDDYTWKRDSIISNLLDMGRPTIYNHDINISYQLPLNKIKMLNFMNASTRYRSTYNWTAGAITADTINLGNYIQNTQNWTSQASINMTNIYNKVPYFKKINAQFKSTGGSRSRSSRAGYQNQQQRTPVKAVEKELSYSGNIAKMTASQATVVNHKLATENVKATFRTGDGKAIAGRLKVIDKNQIEFTPTADATGVVVAVTGMKEKVNTLKKILDFSTRVLLGVQNITFSYNITGGTSLPGYLPTPSLFGGGRYNPNVNSLGDAINSNYAPGVPFLFGWQDEGFARKASEKGWLTDDPLLNQPFIMNKNERISIRSVVEPIPDLRIDFQADRSFSKNVNAFYNSDIGDFDPNSRTVSGNFSMSLFTWGTAFSAIGTDKIEQSEAFETFKDNRIIIAERLADQRKASVQSYSQTSASSNFPDGYGSSSAEVLVPAFLAAYTNKDPETVSLDLFPSVKAIRPNWRVSYDGMVSKIPALNKLIKSLNFTHSYNSRYSVGSYQTNLNFTDDMNGYTFARDIQNNFVMQYEFNSININETFNPLINMDIMWNNDFTTRAEIKRSRNMTLSFSNNQLTEVLSNEYVFGLGYRFTQMDLIIKTKNSQKSYSNDLNIAADFSFRKNKTNIRKLDEPDQISAGQTILTIKSTADYMLSDRFQLRVYFDKVINTPLTSVTFPTSNTNFGVSFRFTLAQ